MCTDRVENKRIKQFSERERGRTKDREKEPWKQFQDNISQKEQLPKEERNKKKREEFSLAAASKMGRALTDRQSWGTGARLFPLPSKCQSNK